MSTDIAEKDFLRDEYNNLRQELVNRIGIRYTLLQVTITAFGVIIGFGLQGNNISLMLLYPPLALVLFLAFIANSNWTQKLGDYIEKHIETKVTWTELNNHQKNAGWQTISALSGNTGYSFLGYISARSIFFLTELFALIAAVFTKPEVTFFANWLGVSKPTPDTKVNVLLVIGFICLVLSLLITIFVNESFFKLKEP